MKWFFNKWSFVVLVLVASTTYYFKSRNTRADGKVKLGKVERGNLVQRVTLSGAVTPHKTALLTAPYDGYVQKIYVNVGDVVKAGQAVVSVSQTPSGEGEEIFPLRSPMNGVVVQILKTDGANVAKGGTDNGIVRIDDASKLYVDCDVPEIDYAKLKKGLRADIRVSSLPDKIYVGKLSSMFIAAKSQDKWDRSRVEFPVRIEVSEADARMKSGMSATVDIITEEAKDVLKLRHDYVGRRDNDFFVVKADGSESIVEVGLRTAEAFEIRTGVSEGDLVKQVDFLGAVRDVQAQRPRNGGRGGRSPH